MNKPERKCSNCRYLIPDYSHPCTDGKKCTEQRGWICMPPELEGAFSGWNPEGRCEMHEYKVSLIFSN